MLNSSTQNRSPINHLSYDDKKWFAVYTKYKCEKFVTSHLAKKNIDAYLPLTTRTKRYQRKIKTYEVPLINCYVFVNIDKSQYISTLETEYVMKFLHQGKDLISIPEHEIEILMRITGLTLEADPIGHHSFEIGSGVEVMSGHLAGIKGKVVGRKSKKTFMVELASIGYQFIIDIDHNLLMPLSNKISNIAS